MPVIPGRDQENGSPRPTQAKKRDAISTNKLDVVLCICGPRYAGGMDRRIAVQVRPGKNPGTLSEK
jgi:hypothetical protein